MAKREFTVQKDVRELTENLKRGKSVIHPTLGAGRQWVYLISDDSLLELFKAIANRLSPRKCCELIYILAGQQSVKSCDLLKEKFADHENVDQLSDVMFWGMIHKIYEKEEKQNGEKSNRD